jgi:hypothetical protein
MPERAIREALVNWPPGKRALAERYLVRRADVAQFFVENGLQYYIAGRSGYFIGLLPVAANLLHQATEMMMKGALAKKGATLEQLKELDHNLPTSITSPTYGKHLRVRLAMGA